MTLALLGEQEVRRLHRAAIEILQAIGVHVPHEDVLDLFQEAGARVDKQEQIVKIPEDVVQRCLDSAGKTFTIYGRDRSKKGEFGLGKRNYNSSGGQAHWIDDDLQRRHPRLEDVRTATRLGDALPWVNIVGAMADPHELPIEYRCVVVAAEQLKQTTKPIMFWFHDRASAKFILELFTIVCGSEEEGIRYPPAHPFMEPISPLRFPRHGVDLLFETCRFNLPVMIGPMAQTGATAVGTLAGTMAQENAEILAGLCIVQLIKPGTPVCYGGIPHVFDMQTTQIVFSGPEQALMAVGMAQMARFYKLPAYINVGLTDSKIVDAQAGLEVGITLICGAMSGADIFGHLGICGADQGASLPILLMQHEIIAYVERIMRGIDVTDEKLGIDAIPGGQQQGSFLAEEITVKNFRQELWFPQLLDRRFFDTWSRQGRQDMMARCIAQKNEILARHVPTPMDDDTLKAVDRLIADAKRHLAG